MTIHSTYRSTCSRGQISKRKISPFSAHKALSPKTSALYPNALILRGVWLFAQAFRLLCSFKLSKIFIIACIKLRKLRPWHEMNVRFPSWSKFNKKMQNLRGSSISKSKLWMFFGKKNNEKDGMQIFSDWFDASKRSYAECNNA